MLDIHDGVPIVRKFLTAQIMITSRLSSKAQTTIPQAVRTALRLKQGDEIVYMIEGDRVLLAKAAEPTRDDPFTCFSEWDSEADRRAYADL